MTQAHETPTNADTAQDADGITYVNRKRGCGLFFGQF